MVDGFMDDVEALTDADEAILHAMPMDVEKTRQGYGAASLMSEDAMDLKRRLVFGPTCNICGIESGYAGEGAKTVLPSKASCKMDFRLVPNQTPERAVELLRAHLERRGFGDIEVRYVAGMAPSRSPAGSRIAQASLAAANAVYGDMAYFVPMFAGSGPFPHFAGELGLPVASAGFTAYSDSRPHALMKTSGWRTGATTSASRAASWPRSASPIET